MEVVSGKGCAKERELSGDPPTEGYRSRDLERAVLERELSGYIAAWNYKVEGYRSRGIERALLERELSGYMAAGAYRSTGL